MKCLKCKNESWNSVFCRNCREKLWNATANVSQNKKKLLKLLLINKYTKEWFDKFILYAENIIKFWSVILEYRNDKENEMNKRLDTKIKRIKAWKITYKN